MPATAPPPSPTVIHLRRHPGERCARCGDAEGPFVTDAKFATCRTPVDDFWDEALERQQIAAKFGRELAEVAKELADSDIGARQVIDDAIEQDRTRRGRS